MTNPRRTFLRALQPTTQGPSGGALGLMRVWSLQAILTVFSQCGCERLQCSGTYINLPGAVMPAPQLWTSHTARILVVKVYGQARLGLRCSTAQGLVSVESQRTRRCAKAALRLALCPVEPAPVFSDPHGRAWRVQHRESLELRRSLTAKV